MAAESTVIRMVKTKAIRKRISKGKKGVGHERKQKYELRVAGVKSSSASKAIARRERGSKMVFGDLERQVNPYPFIPDRDLRIQARS